MADLIALVVVAVALVLLGLATGLAIQRSRRAEAAIARSIATLGTSVQSLSAELGASLERVRSELRHTTLVGGLASAPNLDDLLDGVAVEAASLTGARTGFAGASTRDGTRSLRSSGAEIDDTAIAFLWPTAGAEAVTFVLGREPARLPGEPRAPAASGVVVPVVSAGEPRGLVGAVFDVPTPDARAIQLLSELASRVAPLLTAATLEPPSRDGARPAQPASPTARTPASPGERSSGAGSRRRFHDLLSTAVERARRDARSVAVLTVDIDDFHALNEELGPLACDRVLAALAERVDRVLRSTDAACRIGGDEFGIVLTGATSADAEQAFDRLQRAVDADPPAGAPIRLSAGIAELDPGDDAVGLFERAERALGDAKRSGKGHAVVAVA